MNEKLDPDVLMEITTPHGSMKLYKWGQKNCPQRQIDDLKVFMKQQKDIMYPKKSGKK